MRMRSYRISTPAVPRDHLPRCHTGAMRSSVCLFDMAIPLYHGPIPRRLLHWD